MVLCRVALSLAALHPEELGDILLEAAGCAGELLQGVSWLSPPHLRSRAGALRQSCGVGSGPSSVWVFLAVTPAHPLTPSPLHLTLLFSDLQLVPKLSRNYLKEGYMEKTGPKVGYEAFFSPCKHDSCSVWPQEGVAGGTNQPLPERQSHNSVNVFNALSSPGSKH